MSRIFNNHLVCFDCAASGSVRALDLLLDGGGFFGRASIGAAG